MVATSGDKLRIPAAEASRLNVDPQKQNAMMDDRWTYFHFPRTFQKHEVAAVKPCASCCAKWLNDDLPVAASSSNGMTSHVSLHAPPLPSAPPAGSAAAFVSLLERVQHLHSSGALSNEEFAAAKRKLLQLD